MRHGRRKPRSVWLLFLPLILGGCSATGVSALAIRGDEENYVGRYAGGGAHFGEAREVHEGTWARDYAGLDRLHLVELRWSHSPRHRQGGMGSY